MYRLVVGARFATRHIAPRLQIQIIISALATCARQEVQLCTEVNDAHFVAQHDKLTSPITAPCRRDDGIALQPPRSRRGCRTPYQRLVARARGLDVEVCGGALALDGAADSETLGGGLRP